MVTIYDISKATGLSAATVSKALNNYPDVSEKTRKKILDIAAEMNYVPNFSARVLQSKKSYMVGVLLDERSGISILHPHFSEVIQSFKEQMEINGYDTLFLNHKIGNTDITYLEHCKYRGLDGVLIVMGSIKDKESKNELEEIIESKFPIVSVDDVYKGSPSIISDNYSGAKKILEYLYHLGHKKIGIIKVSGNNIANLERSKAYYDFLSEKKIDLNENFVYVANGFSFESGSEIVKSIVKNGVSEMPTAIFCIYDEIAIGAINELKNLGINIPDDISIAGFDDLYYAKYSGLTTAKQNRKEIGSLAAKKLLEVIENPNNDLNSDITYIPTELILRSSCKKLF